MNKTIHSKMLKRFGAIAQEAEFLGKFRLAESLTKQMQKYAEEGVRGDDSGYHYPREELMEDVKECVWDAVVRLADFYQVSLDAEFVEQLAEDTVDSLVEEFQSHHDVVAGAYEKPLLGEDEIEVTFDDGDM